MDIEKAIINYLNSIKNQFNEVLIESRLENIESSINRLQKLIPAIDTGKYSLNDLLDMTFDSLKVDVLFESGSIALLKQPGLWSIKRKYVNGSWTDVVNFLQSKYSKEEALSEAKKVAVVYDSGYTKIDRLEIPSGKLVFANYFLDIENEYAFDIPNELRHKDEFSINNKYGRQNCMSLLAKVHNLGYTQLGNVTAEVFKVNDNQIFVGPTWYCDKEDRDVPPPRNWQSLGSISCSVWRIEFIDNEYLKNKNNLNRKRLCEEDKVIAKVTPGTWSVRNYYHDLSDKDLAERFGFPVWVELNRIK